jgi:hypothetical protein
MAVVLVGAAHAADAQWPSYPAKNVARTPDGKVDMKAPPRRAPDGHVDLSGFWMPSDPVKHLLNLAADLKPGDVPLLPSAAAVYQERIETNGKDHPGVRCWPSGIPEKLNIPDGLKLIQTPDVLIFLFESRTIYRQVFTDGRPLPPSDAQPTWMGYSVGRWEDDTLVVETIGYNDRTWLDHDGHPHTEQLRTTERYRRRTFGTLDIEMTISDPGAYAKPWTVAARAELAPDTEMIEWVCNESPHGVEHWVGKASDERKGEVQVDPAILSRYIGTYVEQPPLWRNVARVVQITVAGGKLVADMDGRGPVTLLATSNSEFTGLYGLGVGFIDGGAGGLFVKHVSGNYRFAKK